MKKYLTLLAVVTALLLMTACNPEKKRQNTGKLELNSNPQGADVIVNSETKYKQTPLTLNLEPGTYLIKMTKDGYLPVWRYAKIKGGKKVNMTMKLPSAKGAILIESKPSGAEVVIAGKMQGTTPLVLTGLKTGEYSAELKLLNRAARSIKWEITDERPKKVVAALESNVGKISLKTVPTHARVYIDDKACGFTPYNAEVQEGKHEVKVNLSGFAEVKTPINILRDQQTIKTINLIPLPGAFKFLSTPEGARVYINDKAFGKTPLKVDDLQSGKYKVRVDKNGFDSISRDAYITAGRVNTVEFMLKRNTGGIDLIVNPPGVTIYVNGKKHSMTVPGESKGLSKVTHIRNLPAGKYQIMLAHKRMMPPKKTYRITVRKARITRPKPIDVWVANAVLKLKNESKKIVLLLTKDKDHIIYSPEPGVKIKIPENEMHKVEFVRPLTEADE